MDSSSSSAVATVWKLVAKLKLKPNPEGGLYSETFRDSSVFLSASHLPPTYKVDRAVSTCIYFLLPCGSVSHIHRIPMAETWHFYMGQPLTVVELNESDGKVKFTCIGADQQVQYTVPPYVWFGAFPTNDIRITIDDNNKKKALKTPERDPETHFSLVGCTCAPAFQFEDFELAERSRLANRFPEYESLISLLTTSHD